MPGPTRYVILSIDGGPARSIALGQDNFLNLGRADRCDIQFVDKTVGRLHGVIQETGGRWSITHLAPEAAATRLNGVELPSGARKPLQVGDEVGLAGHSIRIVELPLRSGGVTTEPGSAAHVREIRFSGSGQHTDITLVTGREEWTSPLARQPARLLSALVARRRSGRGDGRLGINAENSLLGARSTSGYEDRRNQARTKLRRWWAAQIIDHPDALAAAPEKLFELKRGRGLRLELRVHQSNVGAAEDPEPLD